MRDELIKRGISREEEYELLEAWKRQTEEKALLEQQYRASESFGISKLIWMGIRWPLTLLSNWSLRREGFIRKHKERLYAIGLGILLWVFMFIAIAIKLGDYERERQNFIESQDIYEWEINQYSPEEIAESRRKSIEKVIATVQANETSGISTYIILEKDTLPNSEVTRLRELDMNNIRDVVFQKLTEPQPYDRIEIVLVNSRDKDY